MDGFFMKFDIWGFFKKYVDNINASFKSGKIKKDPLDENQFACVISSLISSWNE